MRSSELRKLKLFEMRIKTWNFRTTTHGVRSNAFLTTVSAHCAMGAKTAGGCVGVGGYY